MTGDLFVEHEEYWELPLTGKSVSRFRIDYHVLLDFLDSEDELTTVEIEADFKLKFESAEYMLSPEKRTALGPIFDLFANTVQSAVAYKNGILEITFVDNSILTVSPKPELEAWQFIGSKGMRIVCTGGGQIFTWQGDHSRPVGGGLH